MARDSERGEEKLKHKSGDTQGEKCSRKSSGGEATTAQPETSYDKLLRKCSNTILYLYQTV